MAQGIHRLKPQLIEQRDLLQVKLILSIETKSGTKDFGKEMSERQRVIIEMIATNPFLSAKTISEKFTVTDRTIENDLAQLKKKGILDREGGRKKGRWVIINKKE